MSHWLSIVAVILALAAITLALAVITLALLGRNDR